MIYIPPPSTLPPGSIVWSYYRDSGGESQEQSVPQQHGVMETYCQEYGLVLARYFMDVAKTAATAAGRDAFYDLISLANDPKSRPDGLLMWNFARFARNLNDAMYYKAKLRTQGITIHSITDPIPEGNQGRIIETLIDYTNNEKLEQTSRDVKRALTELIKKGYAPGGAPPKGLIAEKETIGFRRNGTPRIVSKWVPDPELWDLVILAWKMRKERHTYNQLTEVTHGRLYKSKNSWTTFFSNKTYLGIGKFGDLEVPNHHPAAIDQETWDVVQKIQEEMKKPRAGPTHPRTRGNPHLLNGLAYCIHCGELMIKHMSGRNHWDCYICGKKRKINAKACIGSAVNTKEADKKVFDALMNRILTADFASSLLAEIQAQFVNSPDLEAEASRLRRSLADTKRAINNLLDTIEKYGAGAMLQRLKDREADQARMQAALVQVESKMKFAQIQITPEAVEYVLHLWRDELLAAEQTKNVETIKALMMKFVAKVELGYDTARIWYTYPLNAFQKNNVSSSPVLGGTN